VTDTLIAVEATGLKRYAEGTGVRLEDRLRSTMKAARTQCIWATDDDSQLRAALGAVLLVVTGGDKDRLITGIENLKKASATIQALVAGVPLDWENLEAPGEGDLKIMELWRDSK
jgi:hypothetical protein